MQVVKYQQEFLSQIKDEMEPLIAKDWDEVGQDHIPLDVDWEAYFDLEESGVLQLFTARKEGLLVGYFLTMTVKSLQSRNHFFVTNDAIYVDPEHRGVGKGLFQFVENCLKEDGHTNLIVTTTEKFPIDSMMYKMGYKRIETRFEKVL